LFSGIHTILVAVFLLFLRPINKRAIAFFKEVSTKKKRFERISRGSKGNRKAKRDEHMIISKKAGKNEEVGKDQV